MRQPVMLPTVRPPDDSPTRIAFTVHGISLPHITPPLDQIVPYDSQCDPALVAPSWKEMGLAVARIMKPHLPSSSVLLPFMMPLVETNLPLFQACVKGHQGTQYSVEPITREEKTSGLTEPTIDRTLFQMMFGDIPMPLDGKLPHWAVVESIVCVMPGCSNNVHVQGFTVIVNGSIGTLDTSLAYQCPHKNCLVCIECAELSVATGGDNCPACQGVMSLVDRKCAVETATTLKKINVEFGRTRS